MNHSKPPVEPDAQAAIAAAFSRWDVRPEDGMWTNVRRPGATDGVRVGHEVPDSTAADPAVVATNATAALMRALNGRVQS
jgi:hypothetical protein